MSSVYSLLDTPAVETNRRCGVDGGRKRGMEGVSGEATRRRRKKKRGNRECVGGVLLGCWVNQDDQGGVEETGEPGAEFMRHGKDD